MRARRATERGDFSGGPEWKKGRTCWYVEDKVTRHVYLKPSSPQLNGEVEHSYRSDEWEFYQRLSYKDDVDLEEKLDEWGRFYNFARPHGDVDGKRRAERSGNDDDSSIRCHAD